MARMVHCAEDESKPHRIIVVVQGSSLSLVDQQLCMSYWALVCLMPGLREQIAICDRSPGQGDVLWCSNIEFGSAASLYGPTTF